MRRTTPSFVNGRLVPVSVFLALGLFTTPAHAVTFPDKPPKTAFFVDEAELIKPEDASAINEIASKLLSEKRVPLFVVTVRSLSAHQAAGGGVERYARNLFDHWGIGWQDRNYGMLLLVAFGDRKARIELGADWSGQHDAAAQNVMDDLIVPQFKRGDFSLGILDGVRGMDAMARGLALPTPTAPWWFWPAIIIGAIFLVVVIINLFRSGRKGWAWALIAAIAVILFFVLSRAASGSGGGFGGGSGGGGGASGSW